MQLLPPGLGKLEAQLLKILITCASVGKNAPGLTENELLRLFQSSNCLPPPKEWQITEAFASLEHFKLVQWYQPPGEPALWKPAPRCYKLRPQGLFGATRGEPLGGPKLACRVAGQGAALVEPRRDAGQKPEAKARRAAGGLVEELKEPFTGKVETATEPESGKAGPVTIAAGEVIARLAARTRREQQVLAENPETRSARFTPTPSS